MTNLDSILKSRDITLPTKVYLVKAIVFPVVMYGCESWTVKKAECWKIDAFELWCWRRLLRVPWAARRSNQSIVKEISPGCSLEGLMLKLKLQYSGHLMRRADSLEKTLMLGGFGGRRSRGWDGWMASPTQRTYVWASSRSWWWTGKPGVLQSMGSSRVGHDWATELNWTLTSLLPHQQPIRELCMSRDASLHLAFKNAFLKPVAYLDFFRTYCPGLLVHVSPYSKHCSFLHHNLTSGQ